VAGTSSYEDDESGGAPIVDINVTPLVDIVLVLLIIFMVTAKLIAGRAVTIESPKTVSGEAVQTTLNLTLDKDGKLYLNGAPQPDRSQTSAAIKRAVVANPELQAIISADQRVSHGAVMAVIDLVKLAGVKRFGLTSEEPQK
jgi:biopolymer transport protein ExbD